MAVTSATALVGQFVVDSSTPANNNTFYVSFFVNDGSYSSSISVNADITQTTQQISDAIATAVANAINTALGTALTSSNIILINRPSDGTGLVMSGTIASGSIGNVQIASGGFGSGAIASGAIAGQHLASGTLNAISGNVTVSSGTLVVAGSGGFSGTLSAPKFDLGADLAILPIVGNQSVIATWWSLQLKGNMQATVDHVPTAVGANNAFSVVVPNQKPASVGLGVVSASGQTGDLQQWLGSGASVVAAAINASGEFRGTIASGVVTSGAIASGSISDFNFASGAKIDSSEWSVGDNIPTAEMISGGRYVTSNSSGQLVIAMATQSGREECIGVVIDNTLSGQTPRRYYGGRLFSSRINMSGFLGQPVFLSLSGDLTAAPGQAASLGSGNNQVVGIAVSVSGMLLSTTIVGSGNVGRYRIASGGVLSGHIGSGQIGSFHLSSGCVSSGNVSSGSVQGQAGSTFGIASGTLRHNDFGSGAIQSGDIASGQVGSRHLASGSVVSGRVASGSLSQFVLGSGTVSSGHINSGNIITCSRNVCEDSYATTETISGVRCVRVIASGFLQIAMAAVSGRMPADGIAVLNALSGSTLTFIRLGQTLGVASEVGSGYCVSGRQGSRIYVGSSGQVVTISGGGPTIGVGATNSGGIGQMMGRITNSGAITILVDARQFSGAATITTDSQFWPL